MNQVWTPSNLSSDSLSLHAPTWLLVPRSFLLLLTTLSCPSLHLCISILKNMLYPDWVPWQTKDALPDSEFTVSKEHAREQTSPYTRVYRMSLGNSSQHTGICHSVHFLPFRSCTYHNGNNMKILAGKFSYLTDLHTHDSQTRPGTRSPVACSFMNVIWRQPTNKSAVSFSFSPGESRLKIE